MQGGADAAVPSSVSRSATVHRWWGAVVASVPTLPPSALADADTIKSREHTHDARYESSFSTLLWDWVGAGRSNTGPREKK